MREANRSPVPLDHARGDGRLEGVCANPRPLQQRLRGRAYGRGQRERLTSWSRQGRDPRTYELFERLRNRERLERIGVGVEDAGHLQGEERVAGRPLLNADQRLPCEG